MNQAPEFAPGFRLSIIDLVVLVGAVSTSVVLGSWSPSVALIIAFVVLHFFLFCNVFRIARALELVWAALFMSLATCTILFAIPGWVGTVALSFVGTIAVIMIEMRRPSYHGVLWKRLNPRLREWWDAEVVGK